MSQQHIDELEQRIKELEAEVEFLRVDNKYLQLRLKVELEKNPVKDR